MWNSLVPVYILLSIAHSNVAQVFLNLIIFAHWKHLVVKNVFLMEFVWTKLHKHQWDYIVQKKGWTLLQLEQLCVRQGNCGAAVGSTAEHEQTPVQKIQMLTSSCAWWWELILNASQSLWSLVPSVLSLWVDRRMYICPVAWEVPSDTHPGRRWVTKIHHGEVTLRLLSRPNGS